LTDFIKIEDENSLRLVTLNRPDSRNALNAAMRARLQDALAEVNGDPSLRAVVVTGAGKAFCAGQDLAEARAFDPDDAEDWVAGLRDFLASFRDLDKPCVAAVNGVAAGAGFQVALLCDMRIGHAGTRMGQPEINAGLASVIGVHLMGLTLGHAQTRDLALTGRLVDSEEALRLGLLTRVVPQEVVLDEAIAAALDLAGRPPNAMRLTKQRLREMTQAGFDEAFAAAARLQRAAYATGEPQAAMARFFEKRAKR
jgi:enoyl-CoA hydratase/carnithine racemase